MADDKNGNVGALEDPSSTSERDSDKPGFLARQRAAHPWFDHVMRAAQRYQNQKGDYYAAGITYFSVLSLVPILMVVFAVAGFVLAGRPDLLDEIKNSITDNAPGSLGSTLNDLVDSAISSRNTVGVLGLLGAAYGGLGWMANVRNALTAMWESKHEDGNFLRTKLGDAGALIGLGLALVVSLGLSALGSGPVVHQVVEWLNLDNVTGIGTALRILSIVVGLVAMWAVFAWVIARLPREPVAIRSALGAAVLAAVAFEIFKQVGAVYLSSVLSGPAGVAFGPILGLLVFVFFTARMLLFCTAWAATTRSSLALAYVPPPDPAVISPRVTVREGPGVLGGLALVGVGALAVLGVRGFGRRR
ncbi:inner membrane protein YhjD [Rhodococcus sp. HNM0569]|uniref:inner membrane protein YhjD n=1 Tax=Rhodococcus sp. HNM0569 TaxID=2716340 RepID=UPI00146AA600|nr:inner membrane protein YhjD [Rhodococcus sp. HNM0569]NLU81828.1 inner membrane protein YhjD [Rhodococcus sp. HNM0569]